MYRKEFTKALSLLAKISGEAKARGVPIPILVGGAAVELFTASEVVSADFDLVAADQDQICEIMLDLGFERYQAKQALVGYWVHKETEIVVEFVGSQLMDGHTNREYIQLVKIDVENEDGEILVIPIEDLIADRLAQYQSSPNDNSMLKQAQVLWNIASELDIDYITKRISQEAPGLEWSELLGARQ